MEAEFSVGQKVALRSGGPEMTVAAYNDETKVVSATYFNEVTGLFVVDVFYAETLNVVK